MMGTDTVQDLMESSFHLMSKQEENHFHSLERESERERKRLQVSRKDDIPGNV